MFCHKLPAKVYMCVSDSMGESYSKRDEMDTIANLECIRYVSLLRSDSAIRNKLRDESVNRMS